MTVLFARSVEVADTELLILFVPLLTLRTTTVMERAVGTAFDSMCSSCSISHPSRATPTLGKHKSIK